MKTRVPVTCVIVITNTGTSDVPRRTARARLRFRFGTSRAFVSLSSTPSTPPPSLPTPPKPPPPSPLLPLPPPLSTLLSAPSPQTSSTLVQQLLFRFVPDVSDEATSATSGSRSAADLSTASSAAFFRRACLRCRAAEGALSLVAVSIPARLMVGPVARLCVYRKERYIAQPRKQLALVEVRRGIGGRNTRFLHVLRMYIVHAHREDVDTLFVMVDTYIRV